MTVDWRTGLASLHGMNLSPALGTLVQATAAHAVTGPTTPAETENLLRELPDKVSSP